MPRVSAEAEERDRQREAEELTAFGERIGIRFVALPGSRRIFEILPLEDERGNQLSTAEVAERWLEQLERDGRLIRPSTDREKVVTYQGGRRVSSDRVDQVLATARQLVGSPHCSRCLRPMARLVGGYRCGHCGQQIATPEGVGALLDAIAELRDAARAAGAFLELYLEEPRPDGPEAAQRAYDWLRQTLEQLERCLE